MAKPWSKQLRDIQKQQLKYEKKRLKYDRQQLKKYLDSYDIMYKGLKPIEMKTYNPKQVHVIDYNPSRDQYIVKDMDTGEVHNMTSAALLSKDKVIVNPEDATQITQSRLDHYTKQNKKKNLNSAESLKATKHVKYKQIYELERLTNSVINLAR